MGTTPAAVCSRKLRSSRPPSSVRASIRSITTGNSLPLGNAKPVAFTRPSLPASPRFPSTSAMVIPYASNAGLRGCIQISSRPGLSASQEFSTWGIASSRALTSLARRSSWRLSGPDRTTSPGAPPKPPPSREAPPPFPPPRESSPGLSSSNPPDTLFAAVRATLRTTAASRSAGRCASSTSSTVIDPPCSRMTVSMVSTPSRAPSADSSVASASLDFFKEPP